MLRRPLTLRRILMTTDAVGGVWRYAVDAARGLSASGIEVVLAGSGPPPSGAQLREVDALSGVDVDWLDTPLDWMAASRQEVEGTGAALARAAERHRADLLHLNAPFQALGLPARLPRVVVSHSCMHTWWGAVREGPAPDEWRWRHDLTLEGFQASDVVLVPSASHGRALSQAYGKIRGMRVVPNAAVAIPPPARPRERVVLAAGRWWDEGKNGAALDAAARLTRWPIVMAGALDGPSGESFRAKTARTLGPLDAEALRARMTRAAVFSAPSLYEPFGLAVLEAALAGSALVLSDIPTFREFWAGAAIFADPRNAGAFAAGVEALAADDSLRCDLARRARRRAEQFTVERQTNLLLEAYATALAADAIRCRTTSRPPALAEAGT